MSLLHTKGFKELVRKYNVAAPRYTSYPTVPFWDLNEWSKEAWIKSLQYSYSTQGENGIGIYVHLPFCESLCTYCGCNTRITKNHAVEHPYIQSLLKEWGLYKGVLNDSKPRIKELHLGGGTPTFFSPENLRLLIEGLLGDEKAESVSFSFEAHPANTTYEHLEELNKLGFKRLSLGIQDFDPVVQKAINRKQTLEDVARVMDEARSLGYNSINFDLIYGLPFQNKETVRDTIEKALALSPDRISFYSYAHVPWLKPAQRLYTEKDLPQGEEKLALYLLGKEMILDAGYEEVGMDHFAKKEDSLFEASQNHTLHRNFMGYTDQHIPVQIGLGVSSISDSWNAFAQNVKTVEEYHAILNKNEIPVFKGHILNQEDEGLRKHILNIMCIGFTEWQNDFEHKSLVLEGLESLEKDGLVELSDNSVRVTEVGKYFLRNIGMCFDIKWIRNKKDEPTFSQAV